MADLLFLLLLLAQASPPAAASESPAESVVVRPGGVLRLHVAEGHRSEAAWDGRAFQVVDGQIELPEAEGDHWLAIASRAPSGLLSELTWTRVRVDATAPAIEFVPPPGHRKVGEVVWLAPRTPLVVRAEDQLAGVRELEVRAADASTLSAAAAATPGAAEVEVLTSGDHGRLGWSASATDRVGNAASAEAGEMWVDAEAPEGRFLPVGPYVDGDDLWIVGPATSVEPRFEDPDSGLAEVRVELDGSTDGGAGASSSRCCAGVEEGLHELVAVARDRVGNERRVPQRLRVDATPPSSRLEVRAERSVATDAGEVYSSPAEVTVVAEDDVAGVASLAWSGGADARRAVTVRASTSFTVEAVDRVDNRSQDELRALVDGDGPRLVLRAAGGAEAEAGGSLRVASGEGLSVVGDDPGAGVERVEVSRRYRYWYRDERYRLRERFDFTTPGEYRVYARAWDRLGNESRARWNVVVGER